MSDTRREAASVAPRHARANWASLARIVEIALALAIAALGVWHIWGVDEPDASIGLALVGLALLFYVARGQTLTKMAAGPAGISVEFLAKVDAAVATADSARKTAIQAKQLAGQQIVPGGRKPADRSPVAGWVHPGLAKGKLVKDDQQKGQWGGQPERNGRRLSAKVSTNDDDWFEIVLTVATVGDARPVTGRVRFHLHDSFGRDDVVVRPRDGVARLTRIAYGAFTVGAEIEDEPGTYLELDLAAAGVDAPAKFKAN